MRLRLITVLDHCSPIRPQVLRRIRNVNASCVFSLRLIHYRPMNNENICRTFHDANKSDKLINPMIMNREINRKTSLYKCISCTSAIHVRTIQMTEPISRKNSLSCRLTYNFFLVIIHLSLLSVNFLDRMCIE